MTIGELKKQLEEGIEAIYSNECHGLKENLTIGDLLKFKESLSAVNNILAVAQTCAFADYINLPEIKNHIEKPNKNGFDIQYSSGGEKIIAELKATVPCGKNGNYGANQRGAISDDLKHLSGESKKADRVGIDPTEYKKYMVLFALDGQREAMTSLDKYAREHNIKVEYIDTDVRIDKYEAFGWKD